MSTEEQIRRLRTEKQALDKLMENAEFQRFIGEIESHYAEAEAAHENPVLTAEHRSEWLYAMKKLRILKNHHADRMQTLKRDLASLGARE